MAESFSKKPKLMPPRAQRIRYSIQLEVEAGMEERLEGLKAKIQRVKSALRITSRTPMGNLLMMERLLSSFEEFERSQMVITASQSLFLSTIQQPSAQPSPQPSPQPFPSCSKKIDAQTQTDISDPYILGYGENTTGKFDIHTQSTENEDYFLSSNDAVRNLISTMAQYGGRCPLWLSSRVAIVRCDKA